MNDLEVLAGTWELVELADGTACACPRPEYLNLPAQRYAELKATLSTGSLSQQEAALAEMMDAAKPGIGEPVTLLAPKAHISPKAMH